MMERLLDIRKYTMSEQRRFAELSGDFNPLHLDPIKARRELFGDVVVHGMHGLLHALDAYLTLVRARGVRTVALEKLAGRFAKPIFMNQKVGIYLVNENKGQAMVQVRGCDEIFMGLEVHWAKADGAQPTAFSTASSDGRRATPVNLTMDEIANRQGELDLYVNRDIARTEFPSISALVSCEVLANILGLSRLVGTECPGLHSIFSSFNLNFCLTRQAGSSLKYEVTRVEKRLSMVKIALYSAVMSGSVDAFYRPVPQKQPDIEEVQKVVGLNEFTGQRALIIGGSRGLGEVTAKIVACGGGYPVITYCRGLEDARRVAFEIEASGGKCKILQCDVSCPKEAISKLAGSGYTPSHLYYFASPKILRNMGSYRKRLLRTFTKYYVDGLLKTYKAYRTCWQGKVVIFYPSTVMLEKKTAGFGEYSEAKLKGEALCEALSNQDPELSVIVKRLPKIATDQTITLFPDTAAGALESMVKIVRELPECRIPVNRTVMPHK